MLEIGTLLFYAFLVVFTLIVAKVLPFPKAITKRKTVTSPLNSRKWSDVFSFLGLTYKKGQLKQIVFDTFALFFVIIFILTLESVLLSVFNLDDSSKVAVVISEFSLLTIIISSTLGPFAEEVFFRGFLQKYLGVFIAALIFAGLHFGFGSVTEIIGAFTAGIILGYWVKYRSVSLWPAIAAHGFYNLVSILLVVVK